MIGQLDPDQKHTSVVGGGISGLLVVNALLDAGHHVTLFEEQSQLGGLIGSRQEPEGLVERAAHSLRSSPALMQLCDNLGVPLVYAQTNKKYVWRGGRMRRIPLSPGEIVNAAWAAATRRAPQDTNRTMEAFARHHLGAASVDAMFAPMLRGIYATGPDLITQPLAFPAFSVAPGDTLLGHALKRRRARAGKSRHRIKMVAPQGGIGMLTEALARKIMSHQHAEVRLGERIDRLPEGGNLVLSVPAYVAQRLLKGVAPETAAALARVTYVPMLTITVFAERESGRFPEGVGVLCAANESPRAMGVLFNSSALPGRIKDSELVSLSFMYGGNDDPDVLNLSDSELQSVIAADARLFFGSDVRIRAHYPNRWERALPRYDAELSDALSIASEGWCATPGKVLFGNYTGQISVRGLADNAARLVNSE